MELESHGSKAVGQKVIDGGLPSKTTLGSKSERFARTCQFLRNFCRGSKRLPQLSRGSAGTFNLILDIILLEHFVSNVLKCLMTYYYIFNVIMYFMMLNLKYVY